MIYWFYCCEVDMNVLGEEKEKLKEIQHEYQDLIFNYQNKIKKITADYKNDPFMQATLLEQCTTKLQLLKRTINTPSLDVLIFCMMKINKIPCAILEKLGY